MQWALSLMFISEVICSLVYPSTQYLSLSHPSQWNPSGCLGFLANFHKCPNGSQQGSTPLPPCSYLIPTSFPVSSHWILPVPDIQYKLLSGVKCLCLHMFSVCDRHGLCDVRQYGCCLAWFFSTFKGCVTCVWHDLFCMIWTLFSTICWVLPLVCCMTWVCD